MKLHHCFLNVTPQQIDSIPPEDSLHFDLTEDSKVLGNVVSDPQGTILQFKNPNLTMFYGPHNRYFTINRKDYWVSAIQVNGFMHNPITNETEVYLEGKFVSKEKSMAFILNRDMTGHYIPSDIIETLAKG